MSNYKYLRFPDIAVAAETTFPTIIQDVATQSGLGDIHAESNYIISHFFKGEFIYSLNGKDQLVQSNQLIITHPNEPHKLIIPKKHLDQIFSMSISNAESLIAEMIQKPKMQLDQPEPQQKVSFRFNPYIQPDNYETIQLIKKLSDIPHDYTKHDETDMLKEVYCRKIFYSVLEQELKERIRKAATEKQDASSVKQENKRRIQIALDFIDAHFNEPITLDQLAGLSNMNKYYFIRIFNQITGHSPFQYIAEKRINYTKHLLSHPQFTITEIALKLGFSNVSSFNKFFTQKVGYSPKQYRKMLL